MKNKNVIIWGTLGALLTVLLFNELFQLVCAWIFGASELELGWNIIAAEAKFTFPDVVSVPAGMVYLSSMFFSFIIVEVTNRILGFTKPGTQRYTLLIFQIINNGYLLIMAFYNTFVLVLNPNEHKDWNMFLRSMGIDDVYAYLATFFFLMIMVGYLGSVTGRFKKFINQ